MTSNDASKPQRPPAGSGPAQSVAGYRQDDERRRDEARIVMLQNQVDELRAMNRDLATRQTREEEASKQNEGLVAQMRLALEQVRQEYQQSSQARALDENRTRQMLQDLDARVEDGIRPIRSLQAHVSELLESARRKVDDSGQVDKRFDDITSVLEHLSAVSDRSNAVAHSLRDTIDAVRGEVEGFRRDIIRAEDAIKIVDQEARRRTTDVREIAEGYSARLDEIRADLGHLYDTFEDQRRALVHVDPSLDELRGEALAMRQDLARQQGQLTERHDVLLEMHDDARQETDARFEQLRQTIDERLERLSERQDELAEQLREMTYRMIELNGNLDELRQVDSSLHRDIWYLHEQRVRNRLEQVQAELDATTAQRREAEGEAQGGLGTRFRRRRVLTDSAER